MNSTAKNAQGTMVYKATNPYSPPEYRVEYLYSIIRKLMRKGVEELLAGDFLNTQYTLKTTMSEGINENDAHFDMNLPFFIKADIPEDELLVVIKELDDYGRRLGFTKALYETDAKLDRKIIFTNRDDV